MIMYTCICRDHWKGCGWGILHRRTWKWSSPFGWGQHTVNEAGQLCDKNGQRQGRVDEIDRKTAVSKCVLTSR